MTKQQKDYFKKERTIKLTEHEMDLIISALETEAENDLKLIKKDCDFEIYSAEIYVNSYLANMTLIKKIKEALEEIKQ